MIFPPSLLTWITRDLQAAVATCETYFAEDASVTGHGSLARLIRAMRVYPREIGQRVAFVLYLRTFKDWWDGIASHVTAGDIRLTHIIDLSWHSFPGDGDRTVVLLVSPDAGTTGLIRVTRKRQSVIHVEPVRYIDGQDGREGRSVIVDRIAESQRCCALLRDRWDVPGVHSHYQTADVAAGEVLAVIVKSGRAL